MGHDRHVGMPVFQWMNMVSHGHTVITPIRFQDNTTMKKLTFMVMVAFIILYFRAQSKTYQGLFKIIQTFSRNRSSPYRRRLNIVCYYETFSSSMLG